MLEAPKEYWQLDETEKSKNFNQCGPDGPLGLLIPNHLLGLDISESCDIHDYMFLKSETHNDRKVADSVFLRNMMTQIEKGQKNRAFWRKVLAYIYFRAARIYSWIQKEKSLDST